MELVCLASIRVVAKGNISFFFLWQSTIPLYKCTKFLSSFFALYLGLEFGVAPE